MKAMIKKQKLTLGKGENMSSRVTTLVDSDVHILIKNHKT